MNSNEVIETIELAFQGVNRPERSLHQFFLIDRHDLSREITDEEWTLAGKKRVDTSWQEIPDEEIKECDCQLPHMQAEEFQYYLPAYMRYSVRYYQKPI